MCLLTRNAHYTISTLNVIKTMSLNKRVYYYVLCTLNFVTNMLLITYSSFIEELKLTLNNFYQRNCWSQQLGGHCDHSALLGFGISLLFFYLEGESSRVMGHALS
jgi:hypothetical protein